MHSLLFMYALRFADIKELTTSWTVPTTKGISTLGVGLKETTKPQKLIPQQSSSAVRSLWLPSHRRVPGDSLHPAEGKNAVTIESWEEDDMAHWASIRVPGVWGPCFPQEPLGNSKFLGLAGHLLEWRKLKPRSGILKTSALCWRD